MQSGSAWTINVQAKNIANCFRHCKTRSVEEIASENLNESLDEEDIHKLETIIKDLGYRDRIDVNYLLDYPSENHASSEVSSLEEIVANIIKNLAIDKVKDDTIDLDSITRKEVLKALTTLYKYLLQFENSTPKLLDAIRKIRVEIQQDLDFKKKHITIVIF
ncbi:hypothetical protein Pint_27542 [Pistacia integerrima]|uniref:Uncharacterized protein n=1 Tax=Pistacia integerrima TaxID=434235 RepID=A0ACC0YT90_9ROSI|nr:hypothetical protein Pint_27542 [Pistacia integerrima]